MAYREISNSVLAPGQILTAETARQIRDNERAVREGAVSAAMQRIKPYALLCHKQDFANTGLVIGDIDRRSGFHLNAGTSSVSTNFITDPQFDHLYSIRINSVVISGADVPGQIPIIRMSDKQEGMGFISVKFTCINNLHVSDAQVGPRTISINCSAFYFRDPLWIPDANREA